MSTSTLAAAAALLPLALLLAVPAMAGTTVAAPESASYTVQADVVRVSPRYDWREVTEPVRHCVEVADPYPRGSLPPHRYARYSGYGYRDHGYRDHGYRDDRRNYRYRDGGAETAAGLVGGLIGGLIGNQFGGGNGKTAFTVAGAMLGASIAGDHVRHSRRHRHDLGDAGPAAYAFPERTSRRCTETTQIRRVRGIDGYDVTYRYQGRTFNKWMHEHPGNTVPVRVAVEPLDPVAP